ncbi:hypothetical protein [Natronorubrum halophilum]|nr:hypothetical protein [Natronorubrum halophilum]
MKTERTGPRNDAKAVAAAETAADDRGLAANLAVTTNEGVLIAVR